MCEVTGKSFSERLHDGMRLLSDDFGEQDGDEFVTFRDEIHNYSSEPDHWLFEDEDLNIIKEQEEDV